MKQIKITISADIPEGNDVEHDAIVSTREPIRAVVQAMAAHGLNPTVESKVTRPKGPRAHKSHVSTDAQAPQELADDEFDHPTQEAA